MDDNPPDSPALDRGDLTTEQRLTASAAVDAMSTEQILRLMNTQDTQVPQVVRHAIPAITGVTDRVVASLHRGGRLIYVGAGSSGRLGVLDAAECPPTFHSDPEQVIGLIAGGDEGLKRAVEGAEDDEATGRAAIAHLAVGENDVVLGIAAGGTTPFVWSALALGSGLSPTHLLAPGAVQEAKIAVGFLVGDASHALKAVAHGRDAGARGAAEVQEPCPHQPAPKITVQLS